MKTYHGSSINNLKTLVSEYSDDENFEGKACYLTNSYQVAKEYAGEGGSIYEVFIEEELLNLTTRELVYSFLNNIFKNLDIHTDDFKFLDAGTTHVLNHHGKNGVWSLGLDIASVLKFEPKFKNREDLSKLEKTIEKLIQDKINSFPGYIISDSGNYPSWMIIHKGPLNILREFKV